MGNTKPSCTIQFFTNLQQLTNVGPGFVKPRAAFGIVLASPTCAKADSATEWEVLKGRLVPVLRRTGYQMMWAARNIRPRPIANEPAQGVAQSDEEDKIP